MTNLKHTEEIRYPAHETQFYTTRIILEKPRGYLRIIRHNRYIVQPVHLTHLMMPCTFSWDILDKLSGSGASLNSSFVTRFTYNRELFHCQPRRTM